MLRNSAKLRLAVLLVGLVFLAVRFHLCTELTSANSASHFCPHCATASAAIAASAPSFGLAPANTFVECAPGPFHASTDAWFRITLRAPPSL